MEVSQETTTRGRTDLTWGRRSLLVFFGLMLVAFGVIFIMMIGRNAIEQRSYDMPWEESRGGFVGVGELERQSSSGVAHFRGADAVREGAGFALFGALLALWGR